jgi:energy-converting hydrogenase Eha subunit F
MDMFRKNQVVMLQILVFCGVLLGLQFLAHFLSNPILRLIIHLSIIFLWGFLLATALVFLALQIINNFRFERSFVPNKLKIKPLPKLQNYRILNPLDRDGIFYKAQLHTHSNLSYDSKVPPLQVINSYKTDGYNILVITDHDVFSDFSKYSTDDFLIMPGIEITIPVLFWPIPLGKHLIMINPKEKRLHYKGVQKLLNLNSNHPGLAIPAHLSWRGGAGSGRWYLPELYRLKKLQFIEIENPHSRDPIDLTIWHKLIIDKGPEHPVWGIAVDDSHSGSSNSGWIMIKTSELSLQSVISSLKSGAFYATSGPTDLKIVVEGTTVHVYASGATWIRFMNAQNQVIMAVRAEEAIYPSTGDEGFIRVEVTNQNRRTAWSQPMWLVPNE